MNGRHNYRADYMTNEYELRVMDGNDVDWFRLAEPTDSDDGVRAEITVECPHASIILKKRNIYLEFDDTNGIGTLEELAARALDGTGWSLGVVDTFYEPDGTTEMVRTYICNQKTGAYKMIQDLCDKFVAYPVFHGDTYTVDLLARKDHVGMLEMRLDKNLVKMSRKRDSNDLITRLNVEGEYGDLGYVGIDDVNPTGLPFLLNFDYYREIGALTPEQEAAIVDYTETAGVVRRNIRTLSAQNEANITQLQLDWGSQGYLLYTVVSGGYSTPLYGNGATSEDDAVVGDTVASVEGDGKYSYRELTIVAPRAGERWMVKFVLPLGGTLAGKEVAIEAKEQTIATLQKDIERASSETEKQGLREQIAATQADIDALKSESATLMLECITLALSIGEAQAQLAELNEQLAQIEATFSEEMGDMLQEGYYSDDTYAPGQEQALYNDSVELLKVLSHPQRTYSLNEIDIANVEGYSDEIFTMNMAVHFFNETININDYGFVSQIEEMLDEPNTRSVEIQTDELNIQSKSFSSFMGRVTDAAQVIKDEQTIFERARAISAEGKFGTDKLDGIIDVLQNKLASTISNWYTDDNGNMIFIAADESSAMMLSGSGFMVADGKDDDGNWNWRTFGTGKGFTADLITAGVLQAGLITILGSDQFYWTGDNLYVIDPENENNQIRIGKYDGEHLGIGYTTDGGVTWQNAIGFDGVHLSAIDNERIDNAGIGGRNYIVNSENLADLTSGTTDMTARAGYAVVGVNVLG